MRRATTVVSWLMSSENACSTVIGARPPPLRPRFCPAALLPSCPMRRRQPSEGSSRRLTPRPFANGDQQHGRVQRCVPGRVSRWQCFCALHISADLSFTAHSLLPNPASISRTPPWGPARTQPRKSRASRSDDANMPKHLQHPASKDLPAFLLHPCPGHGRLILSALVLLFLLSASARKGRGNDKNSQQTVQ